MNEQREALAAHLDKRVAVEAVFDRLHLLPGQQKKWVALVQDAVVTVDGKEIDLGHIWIQNAENFVNIERFARVTFLARVGCRKRVNDQGETEPIYNLMHPTAITPKNPPALRAPSGEQALLRPEPPPPPPSHKSDCKPSHPQVDTDSSQAASSDPVQLLFEVSDLAKRAGGWENLQAIVNMLKK